MAASSIRRRLLWSLLSAVGAVWLIAVIASYVDAHRHLDQLLDANLAQAARLLSAQAGHELLELEELEQEELQQYAQQFAVQLWDDDGELLLRLGAAPAVRFSDVEQGFSDVLIEGVQWRVFSDWDLEHRVLVQIAEPHATRERLARQVALNALTPMFIALPLLGGLIWWIVSSGLAPLQRIGEEVAKRDPSNLASVEVGAVPSEVQPLLQRLNALFARIQRSVENEKRFTADAAHELRNPAAAIRAQAEASLGAEDLAEAKSGLQRIVESSARLSRLVDQLLALARLDAATERLRGAEVDLARLARDTLAHLAPDLMRRGALIRLDAAERAVVHSEPALLEAVIRNLVENAVLHGGEGVQVVVTIAVEASGLVALTVADTGAGVSDAVLANLGRRFVRGDVEASTGSGLGLSIVARIAELHGATLEFGRNENERGLRVRLLFPPWAKRS